MAWNVHVAMIPCMADLVRYENKTAAEKAAARFRGQIQRFREEGQAVGQRLINGGGGIVAAGLTGYVVGRTGPKIGNTKVDKELAIGLPPAFIGLVGLAGDASTTVCALGTHVLAGYLHSRGVEMGEEAKARAAGG